MCSWKRTNLSNQYIISENQAQPPNTLNQLIKKKKKKRRSFIYVPIKLNILTTFNPIQNNIYLTKKEKTLYYIISASIFT